MKILKFYFTQILMVIVNIDKNHENYKILKLLEWIDHVLIILQIGYNLSL